MHAWLCLGFFILRLLSQKWGKSLVWSEAGRARIISRVSQSKEGVKHGVPPMSVWWKTPLGKFVYWLAQVMNIHPFILIKLITHDLTRGFHSNLFYSDRELQGPPGLGNTTPTPDRTRYCVCLLPVSPSPHCCGCCFFVCSYISVHPSPCVCALCNSSCTRSTSRCVSAAVPWTWRKHCWVSLCNVQIMDYQQYTLLTTLCSWPQIKFSCQCLESSSGIFLRFPLKIWEIKRKNTGDAGWFQIICCSSARHLTDLIEPVSSLWKICVC